ncbi:MAG: TIGR03960 family B12-binding radical SAM protein [Chloroflexi bacterium]|nr:MAG: B12-binding domain-containing radical SAM protein [Phototrophicales bacterium]RMF81323.1 MAG: TIGR03960 family B12-binding radical SAM protein [Chloroflexota bacterium]
MRPEQIENILDRVLLRVAKPGRYVGGEYNSIIKDWETIDFKVALAFPDIYDLGMSNLGIMLLYDQINAQSDMLAERVFSPWLDMEDVMRSENIPLFSLESKHAIRDFDLVGISLPYEQLYTNVLNLLDLADMPVHSLDRDETYPVVIAGGHACYNPEPMADFIDAFVIGEGEEIIVEIARTLQQMRGATRHEQLVALAKIQGVYVPRFYEVDYHDDGTLAGTRPIVPEAPARVLKRIVPVMQKPFTKFLVPNIDTVHNRAPIEIMRGCTRGCRFCHAGMITRPVRERPVQEVVDAIDEIIANTGFEEISLLSLSSSDYRDVHELVDAIHERFGDSGLSMSLPSLRIETASAELLEKLGDTRRSGFTFAPEAATERMRDIINKYVPDEQVLQTARDVYSRGWRTIKFYFMIGHPEETLEDVQAIVDLCKAVLAEGRKVLGKKATLNVGVSTFIPKPHTPFQWVPQDTHEQVLEKQALLKRELRGQGFHLRWNDIEGSEFEGFLSRGDRRLGEVIYRTWRAGGKFDAWQDQHRHDLWLQAFDEVGLSPDFYNYRERREDEIFPWDHIDAAVHKKFLLEDYRMSIKGETRVDCRDKCFACGILPKFKDIRSQTEAPAWECPPVIPVGERKKLAAQGGDRVPNVILQP